MRKVRSLQKAPFPAPDVVTKIVPAPTEGWDAISPLAVMDPKRAPILTNWVPRPGWLELRAGYSIYNILLTNAPVETLMVWRGPASEKFFASSDGHIFDVSTFAAGPFPVATVSNDRWQYVNFSSDSSVHVIQMVNGVDSLQQFDGTTWTTRASITLPDMSTVSTSNLINIYAQKRRIWYIEKNSTRTIFLDTDAIAGDAKGALDMGQLWTKGGYLVAMGDWTLDGGNGPQDYAVFISSRGQCAIYSGTDPTDPSAWGLVGVFDIAPPLGRRCFTKVGSDLAVITQQGVLPISQALPFDPSADRSVAITSRIQNAMAAAAIQSGNNFGWQIIGFPLQQLAVLNVPSIENSQQVQFVENVLTGAWTKFTGWNANCFEIYGNDLYFGDNDGTVNKAYDGGLDGTKPIPADMQCAFNYFDDPGRIKRMTMVQPLLTAAGTITPFIEVDEDFQSSNASSPIQILQGGALWDVADWDVAIWPQDTIALTAWLSTQAIGHALAVRMKVNIASVEVSALGEFDLSVFDTATFDSGNSGTAPVLQVNAFNAIMEFGAFV